MFNNTCLMKIDMSKFKTENVTDISGMREVSETTLKRLLLANDVMFINVSDGGMAGKKVYDIGGKNYMPAFLTSSKKLAKLEKEKRELEQKLNLEKEKLKLNLLKKITQNLIKQVII